MAPRRYQMGARAAAVEETRARIVTEAICLFATQTAAATTFDDVAAAAGVSTATVYRHFRDFDTLADACAQTAFYIAEIPTPDKAVEQFGDLPDLSAKLRSFVDISCHCYERATDWLAAERRERHLPAFARTVEREEAALDAIVRGLLEPTGADDMAIAVVKTVVEFTFWHSLVTSGVPRTAVADVMHSLALNSLGESHGSTSSRRRRTPSR